MYFLMSQNMPTLGLPYSLSAGFPLAQIVVPPRMYLLCIVLNAKKSLDRLLPLKETSHVSLLSHFYFPVSYWQE